MLISFKTFSELILIVSLDNNQSQASKAANLAAVDPSEPKYCYCNQVSFGEMVACDNEDVSSGCTFVVSFPH